MKKAWILMLAVCALACAGAVFALNASPAPTDGALNLQSAAGIAGLPTTVLDTAVAIPICWRPDIYCPDVYDPVTCDNGQTYSNSCYAYLACAENCVGGILS